MLAGTLCNMVIDSMVLSYEILHDIVTFTMLYSTITILFALHFTKRRLKRQAKYQKAESRFAL